MRKCSGTGRLPWAHAVVSRAVADRDRLARLGAAEKGLAQATADLNHLRGAAPVRATGLQTASAARLAELQAVRQRADAAIDQARKYLTVFSTGACPTCGQAIPNGEDLIRQSRDVLAASEVETAAAARDAAALKKAIASDDANDAAYARQLDGVTKAAAHWTSTVESLRGPVADTSELAEATSVVSDHARLNKDLTALRQDYNTKAQALQGVDLDLRRWQGIVEAATAAQAPSAAEYAEAVRQAEAARMNAKAKGEADVELAAARARHGEIERRCSALRKQADEQGPTMRWRDMVDAVRQLFHRDGPAAEIVSWYAAELVRHTMTYLKMFALGFELAVTSDYTLLAMFPDKTVSADTLSGGEKNALNVCMRLAMADLVPSELNLLVLDEVEVHLDATNVAKLPALLSKVKALARNRGLVVLFISHHPSLVGVAR